MDQKFKQIIADVLECSVDQINESNTMQNTESWDSLKHMELVTALEQNYDIELPLTEMMEMTSIEGIIRVLETKGVQC